AAAKSESAAASKVLASAETEATAATTGLAASLGPLALVLGAIAAAFMAVKTAVDFTKEAVGAAAKEEGTEAAFIPLLGSLEKAQARIEEVNAAATRFRLDPVALRQADEELTRLSGGALGAGKSLETLIEMGARVRGGVQAVASIYGRFYEALDNGQPIGRAGTQLQRMGLLAAADVNHLNNLQKSGASVSEIMAAAEQALSKASGAADVQANTFEGASKGIKGAWEGVLVAFGTPIRDALTPWLRVVETVLRGIVPAAKAVGTAIGTAVNIGLDEFPQLLALGSGVGALFSGNLPAAVLIFQTAIVGSKGVVETALNVILAILQVLLAEISSSLVGTATAVLKGMGDIFDKAITLAGNFAKGMLSVLSVLPGGVKDSINGAIDAATDAVHTAVTAANAGLDDLDKKAKGVALEASANAALAAANFAKAIAQKVPQNPNAGQKVTVPDTTPVLPDKKTKSGREKEVDEGAEAEKKYRMELDLTKETLALGEISQSEAMAQNAVTITAYIARLKQLQAGLSPTSDKFKELQVRIKDAQQALQQTTVFGQITAKLIQLKNQLADVGKNISDTIGKLSDLGLSTAGNAITALITQTQSLKQVWSSAMQSMISELAQLGVKLVAHYALVAGQMIAHYILSGTIKRAQTAETQTQAAATTAATATPSLLQSILTYGVAAAIGAAAFLAAMAITGGFARGGYTGDGHPSAPAGIVHRGEYVMSAAAVQRIGLGTLEALHNFSMPIRMGAAGYRSGGFVGGAGSGGGGGFGAPEIHTHVWLSPAEMARHIVNNRQAAHIVSDHTGRVIRRFAARR
ncbi:MAG: hypothetical protein JO295_14400, partial [Verrucomicrobia bacterium]|nr:hypothetical protein [Verrucomicrobiota bacterium]